MNDFVKGVLKETKECVEEIEKIQHGYDYYYLFVWGCVEPQIWGPYSTPDIQQVELNKLKEKEGEDKHIYITFNITRGAEIEF